MFSENKPVLNRPGRVARFSRAKRSPVTFWTLLALALLLGAPAGAQQILATGHYTGDGTTGRAIAGVGFEPDLVIVKSDGNDTAVIRLSTMGATISRELGGTAVYYGNGIDSLDADGFTVGSHGVVNSNSTEYYWTAMREEPGVLEIGTYLGNGFAGRNVSTGPYVADAAIVIGEAATLPWFRHTGMPVDSSSPLVGGGINSGGINRFYLGGFEVGSEPEVNTLNTPYHYISWNYSSGLIAGASYLGDSQDNREITGLGLTPEYLLIKSAENENAQHRMASLPGDATLEYIDSDSKEDRIQALQPDGFQLGKHNTVNDNGRTFYWVGFANATTTADLSVAYSVDPVTASEGDTLTYLAAVENLGPEDADGVQVVLSLPTGVTFESFDLRNGSFTSPELVWERGTLAGGDVDSLWVTVILDAGTAGTTLDATAIIKGTGVIDGDPLNNTATASVDVDLAADLNLVHAVDNVTPEVTDDVRFVTHLTNNGPGDATGVIVVADRPAGISFFSYDASAGAYVPGTGTWNVGDLANGSVDSLVLVGRIENGAEGSTIVHGAAITAMGSADPNLDDNTGSVTIQVMAEADLGLSLLWDEPSAAEGDTRVLTVQAWNSGPNDVAATELEVTLPAGLSLSSALPSVGTYSTETGIWDLGAMVTGAADSLALTTQVEAGSAGSDLVTLASFHSSAVADPDTLNNSGSATISVENLAPDIRIDIVEGEPVTVQPLGLPQTILQFTITNQGDAPDTLRGLTLTNLTTGPGSQAQLDSTWGYLGLATEIAAIEAEKALPPTAEFSNGSAIFSELNRVIAPGQTVDITIVGVASNLAPDGTTDGTTMAVSIADGADLDFAVSAAVTSSWPITSGHTLTVDGFSTAQMGIVHVPSKLLAVGSLRNLALIIDLPSNGYLPDTLTRLNIVNNGTALPGRDLARLEAWGDDGDEVFNPISDSPLGTFVHTGDRWELTGLNTAIPAGGRRVFFSVDITETAIPAGNAVRLGIPGPPDEGVGMLSGNDGPLDESLDNLYAMGISVSDRIILTTQTIYPGVVYPATRNLPLIHLEARNTYEDDRTLQRLTITNTTVGGAGATVGDLDNTCRQLVLRHDADGDGILGDLTTDPHLGTGPLEDQQIDFTGLDFTIPSGETAHFFITADLGLDTVAEGDRINVEISSVNDVDITESTIVASWPLNSGSGWSVDGMIAEQLTLEPIVVLTLGPGDGPSLALDLTIPDNGYLTDQLQGLTLVNTGSAESTDLTSMNLWADGGNGEFDAGSVDDVVLGPMIHQSDTWVSPVLDREIPLDGLRIFASLVVSDTPQDSSTVRLAIPIGGIRTLSGNSGPLDTQLSEAGTLVLSTSPLLSSVAFVSGEVTVGMTGEVRMTVSNRGGETVLGILPDLISGEGTAAISLGLPAPTTLDLDPGQDAVFTWNFSSDSPGETYLIGGASGSGETTSLTRRSVATPTSNLRVFTPVPGVDLYPVTNLPFSINRGQTGVVPLTLTLANPGDENVSNGRLTALRILLRETVDGPDIAPSDLLTRLVVSEGTDIYADVNVLSATAGDFEIPLSPAVIITGNEPVTLGVRFDLRGDSTLPSFLLAINQADWFSVTDATSGAAVTLSLGTGEFPIQSAMGNLVTQATSLEASIVDLPASEAGPGQTAVILGEMDLSNLGSDGTSSAIELGSVAFAFRDSTGEKIPNPGLVFSRIALETSFQSHFSGLVVAGPDSSIQLQLSPPALIPGNSTLTLRMTGDIAESPPLGPIQVEAGDPALFDARDANTGGAVSLSMTTSPLSSPVYIVGPAETLEISGTGRLPLYVPQGALGVSAMDVTVFHPGAVGTADISVDTLAVDFFNATREPLDSALLLDSVSVMWGETMVGEVLHPLAQAGRLTIPLTGFILETGQEGLLNFQFDFRPDAHDESMEMSLGADGLIARDVVRGTQVTVNAHGSADLPLYSGSVDIVVAADELVVGGYSMMPAILAPQAEPFPVLRLNLANPASADSGPIAVSQITISQPEAAADEATLGAAVTTIRISVDGQTWATATDIPPNETAMVLTGAEPLMIHADDDLDVVVEVLLKASLPDGSFRVMLAENGIVAQPADVIGTSIFIRAATGQNFPLASAQGNLAAADLAGSYANFPNPFEAGKENTTFVFSLVQDGRVTLRILTPHGEPVITLLDGVPYSAGLHQDDVWRGYNERGKGVRNGVFIAELVVEFGDGTRERVLRKVAVVR
jgi:uncharacterized repeat protein (TIGR01451 family)